MATLPHIHRNHVRLLAIAGLSSFGLFAGCSSSQDAAQTVSSQATGSASLVISGVYGGGGNSGATFLNDYVELKNRGAVDVSLSGMSLQYGGAAQNFLNPVALPNVTLAPGQYFLVKLASGGTVGAALPTADFEAATNMSSSAGKVALVNGTAALGCGGATRCASASIIDMVGYGTSTDYEGPTGSATPGLNSKSAAMRKADGCVDTDVNSADFDIAATAPVPRNTASPKTVCDLGDGGAADASDDGAADAMSDGSDTDAGSDAGDTDASNDDAGDTDAMPGDDAGNDGGDLDGGRADGGDDDDASSHDSGITDAASDAISHDASPHDASTPDAAVTGDGVGLVISAVFGGGGNNGATFNHDFVELHNRTGRGVSTKGLTLQYGSAKYDFGSTPPDAGANTAVFAMPEMVVPAGAYLLVAMSGSAADAGAPLPAPDMTGTLALGSTDGKVALANQLDPLGCGGATRCSTPNIVDMVGYGKATDYEGSGATAALSNVKGAARKDDGCADTDDNKADFDVVTPAPRNLETPAKVCGGDGSHDAGANDSGSSGGKADSGVTPGGGTPGSNGGTPGSSGGTGSNPSANGGGSNNGGCNSASAPATDGFVAVLLAILAAARKRRRAA